MKLHKKQLTRYPDQWNLDSRLRGKDIIYFVI